MAAGLALFSFLPPCSERTLPRGAAPGDDAPTTTTDDRESGPVRMDVLDPTENPRTFVMRGGPRGAARIVFLHGMCSHALGYAQAFQFAAASKGTLIAPQGDKPCGGPWASWSNDIDALDKRIVAAFHALGHDNPDEIVVIGYSQGASRVAALARKWPHRYTRIVLIAGPTAVSPDGLRLLDGAVTMAGEFDRQGLMKKSAADLAAAGVPAAYFIIPRASHGSMGAAPETTFGTMLDWLWAHQKQKEK
jgi:pimeloyl-ACP methyl ester carboxylesterase